MIAAGYLGQPRMPRWNVYDNRARTVHCTILGPGDASKAGFYDTVLRVAGDSMGDEPVFLLCRAKATPARIQEYMTRLRSDLAGERTVEWLTPGDLGATYRAWRIERETKAVGSAGGRGDRE
jgi:hypothetical protein